MIMKINDVEFDCDPTDYELIGRIEEARDAMIDEVANITAAPPKSVKELYKAHIEVIRRFFITSTGVDIVAGCTSYGDAIGFSSQFLELMDAARGKIVGKYNPKRVK